METINCLRKSLLSEPGTTHDLVAIAPSHPFIRSFYEIGTQIRNGLNSGIWPTEPRFWIDFCTRGWSSWETDVLQQFVFKHFYTYVNAIFQSTRSAYDGEIMTVDSYIENRLNNSGTYPTLALFVWDRPSRDSPTPNFIILNRQPNRYAYHLDLPEWILEHEKMQMLMRHISIMVSLLVDHNQIQNKKGYANQSWFSEKMTSSH